MFLASLWLLLHPQSPTPHTTGVLLHTIGAFVKMTIYITYNTLKKSDVYLLHSIKAYFVVTTKLVIVSI